MVHRFQTSSLTKDIRLDIFLCSQLPEHSRTSIRKIIDLGGVHVEGRRTRKSGKLLQPGQLVELHQDHRSLEPYRIRADEVLFEDKYLIVLNKPAGVETQPTPSRYKGTLYEALQIWLKRDQRFGRKLHIGMAQRLDRDTTGVIAFSIHPRSHKGLTEQIQNRSAQKQYLAIVSGLPAPAEGTFESLLARERKSNRMKSVPKGGKQAITHYRTIDVSRECALVSIDLETGRTHQIRIHFSEAGHPLLGDTLYGGPVQAEGQNFSHQCLHSWKLRLRHPISNELMTFTAPPPQEMLQIFHSP